MKKASHDHASTGHVSYHKITSLLPLNACQCVRSLVHPNVKPKCCWKTQDRGGMLLRLVQRVVVPAVQCTKLSIQMAVTLFPSPQAVTEVTTMFAWHVDDRLPLPSVKLLETMQSEANDKPLR